MHNAIHVFVLEFKLKTFFSNMWMFKHVFPFRHGCKTKCVRHPATHVVVVVQRVEFDAAEERINIQSFQLDEAMLSTRTGSSSENKTS